MKQSLIIILLFVFSQHMWSSTSKDTVILQLKWHHQFQFAGFYAAVEKGYYEEKELHLVFNDYKKNTDIVEEVINGNANYGIKSPSLIISRNNNIPVVALAALLQQSPEVLITLNKDIKQIKDMHNKSTTLNSQCVCAAEILLMKYDIPKNNFIYKEGSTIIEDLINNKTDIIASYITNTPYILTEKGLTPNIFKPPLYGVDLYGDILFTSENEVKNNLQRTLKFLKASLKGWEYAMNNKEEICDLIIKKYNPSLTKEQLLYEAITLERFIMPNVTEIGNMNHNRWRHIANTYAEVGLIQPSINLKGFTINDYLPFYIKHYKNIQLILLIIIITSLISLIISFFFNRGLKRAVLKRTIQLSEANNNLNKEIIQRKTAHANLTLSEERFKRLFKDSPISLWEEDFSVPKKMLDNLTAEGIDNIEQYIRNNDDFVKKCAQEIKILDINKATCRYLEADTKEDILGNLHRIFTDTTLKDFAEELIAFYNGNLHFEKESEHITLKGNRIQVSITAKLLNGYESNWGKVIVSLIDISDLKRTTDELINKEQLLIAQNKELKIAKTKAEEGDRLKSAFLSNMSHEIRTPMNGIIGFTDLLKDDILSKEERNYYLNIVEDNSQQLLRIISDIVDISKIEASQLKLINKEIDLRQVFLNLYEVFSIRIKNKPTNNIDFKYVIHSDLPENLTINSDLNRLKQVLTNLLENAIKFTEQGKIEFGIKPTDKDDMLVFYVKDTGIGIKQERSRQIFDRFYRDEESLTENMGGTGLGLSIAKDLVHLLGGQINVNSTPGNGSVFYFTHPYKPHSNTNNSES